MIESDALYFLFWSVITAAIMGITVFSYKSHHNKNLRSIDLKK
jgi:hypothetical protein